MYKQSESAQPDLFGVVDPADTADAAAGFDQVD